MKQLYTYLFQSFTTMAGGFSARKLSAFAGICTAIYLSIIFTDKTTAAYIINSWQVFVFVCLGLVSASKLIELRHEKSN